MSFRPVRVTDLLLGLSPPSPGVLAALMSSSMLAGVLAVTD